MAIYSAMSYGKESVVSMHPAMKSEGKSYTHHAEYCAQFYWAHGSFLCDKFWSLKLAHIGDKWRGKICTLHWLEGAGVKVKHYILYIVRLVLIIEVGTHCIGDKWRGTSRTLYCLEGAGVKVKQYIIYYILPITESLTKMSHYWFNSFDVTILTKRYVNQQQL